MSNVPEKPFDAPPKKSYTGMIILFVTLGVFGMMCVCCGPVLLLPAIQAAREAARRGVCGNNMRQIGMALQLYADANNTLPPAYVADASGQPLYSWRVLLLPYLEQSALFDQFDKEKAWDSPENMHVSETNVPVYRCPSSPGNSAEALTSYVLVTGPQALFDGTKRPTFDDIKDGVASTIMLIETRDLDIHWAEPRDVTFDEVLAGFNQGERSGPGSYHPGGMNVLLSDGSMTFIADSIDPQVLRSLLTPAGEEVVGDFGGP
jgi:hypothetical protein